MTKLTLVIMAAGRANRFGGVKQLTPIGPNNECLMDYAIFDAIRLDFEKVVIVTNNQILQLMQEHFDEVIGKKIKVELVVQDTNLCYEGQNVNPERAKPWGTGHALLTAAQAVDSSFVICNADDYYGYETLKKAADFLSINKKAQALIGYKIKNTLLPGKDYTRALCKFNTNGDLVSLEEIMKIQTIDNKIFYFENDSKIDVDPDTLISMNCWGFQIEIVKEIEKLFHQFLKENIHSIDKEFLLPSAIEELVKQKLIEVKVPETNSTWFGLTYASDQDFVKESVRKEIAKGIYPEKLWK